MKHQHIKHKDPRWSASVWQCECGFKSKFLKEFDAHLKEKSNKIVESTAEKCEICGSTLTCTACDNEMMFSL